MADKKSVDNKSADIKSADKKGADKTANSAAESVATGNKAVKERAVKVRERAREVKKEINKRVEKKARSATVNTVTTNRLKLLITIVNRSKAEYFADLIQSFEVNMQMIVLAEGTASEKMMGLLGLSDNKKAVIFGIIQEKKIPDAMHVLDEKFNTIKDGKGVACTVPLTSVIGTLIYGFLSNNRMTVQGASFGEGKK